MKDKKTNTPDQRQEYILKFLRNKGYHPNVEEQCGFVFFKREGQLYYIELPAEDKSYYRIMKPAFRPLENNQQRQRAAQAATVVNGKIKVAKVMLTHDYTHVKASSESFHHSPKSFTQVFERSINALVSIVSEFTDTMDDLQQKSKQCAENTANKAQPKF